MLDILFAVKKFWYDNFVSLPLRDIPLVSTNPLHGVISDRELEALKRRNELAAKRKIKAMGNHWICHRDNWVQRKAVTRGVLNVRAT